MKVTGRQFLKESESLQTEAFGNQSLLVIADDLEELKAAVSAGLFKREYRDHRLEWMIKSGGLSVVEDGLANDTIRFTEVFSAGT